MDAFKMFLNTYKVLHSKNVFILILREIIS